MEEKRNDELVNGIARLTDELKNSSGQLLRQVAILRRLLRLLIVAALFYLAIYLPIDDWIWSAVHKVFGEPVNVWTGGVLQILIWAALIGIFAFLVTKYEQP